MDKVTAIEGFKYFVVKTDYTSRLIENEKRYSQLTKGIADLNEIFETKELRILYVYDDLWGKGLYKMEGEDKEIDHIGKTLEKYNNEKGVAVFTCEHITRAFEIIELLIKIDYCACMRFTSIEEIKVYDDILYISFGTESG